jgi:phage tail sheath protein FI
MDYGHGVYVSEVATSLIPAVTAEASIPFIVGTAPVNMGDLKNVNKPMLFYTNREAVAACGYVPPKEDAESGLKKFEYSISEFINSQFALFGVGPVIVVNVLDPAKHKKTAETTSITLDSRTGSVTVKETGILLDTVVIEDGSFTKDNDFVISFDNDGYLVISSLLDASGVFKVEAGRSMIFAAEKLDPSAVTADDIVGGVDAAGVKTGLELVSECDPRFNLIPGFILAPGFSGDATVAAVMGAKAGSLNGQYKCTALIDVPTDTVKLYSNVAAWKSNNNITDAHQRVFFPLLALDKVVYHQSVQYAALSGKVDSENDGVPFVTASNKNYQMNELVLADGSEVILDQETANYLNGNGVITALNGDSGWTCWGSRTAAYPGVSDVKDAFSPVRRMFDWIGNTIIKTYRQMVDNPLNRRQIDTVLESINQQMNGWAGAGYILGGRVAFLEEENPTTDMMDGKARFHVYVTPPSPNRELDYILEYDPSYIETIFE